MKRLLALWLLVPLLAAGPVAAQTWNVGSPAPVSGPTVPIVCPNPSTGVVSQCSTGGGGGGGGAITAALGSYVVGAGADGWDTTEGATTQTVCAGYASACTVEQRLSDLEKGLAALNVTAGLSIPSGTNNIGSINNTAFNATSIITNPYTSFTPLTAAYASGTVLNGVQSFTSQPGTGWINTLAVRLSSGTYSGTIDLFTFSASPTSSTTTDGAAFVLASADLTKLISVDSLSVVSTVGAATLLNATPSKVFTLSGTTLYVVPVFRGTVTFAASSVAVVSAGIYK